MEKRDLLRALAALLAVALLLAAGTWATLRGRGPFARWLHRPSPAQQAVTCTVAVGSAGPQPPTESRVLVTPGAEVVVVARCTGNPEIVNLVVSAPAPLGALGVAPVDRLEMGGQVLWVWTGRAPDRPGLLLWWWPWVDGRPAGQPGELAVELPGGPAGAKAK